MRLLSPTEHLNKTGYILIHSAEDVCNFACYSSETIDIFCRLYLSAGFCVNFAIQQVHELSSYPEKVEGFFIANPATADHQAQVILPQARKISQP